MWSVSPYERDRYYSDPMERMMAQALNDTWRGPERSLRSLRPYWLEQGPMHECDIGNAVGPVVNNAEKFAVEVDVSQFRPEELSVNVQNKELIIEGRHEERSDKSGRIERHFVRKYSLPDDALPDSVESHLSDRGILTVQAPKVAIAAARGRKIPIQAAPRHHREQQHQEQQGESAGRNQ